jgi:hypothetical protein
MILNAKLQRSHKGMDVLYVIVEGSGDPLRLDLWCMVEPIPRVRCQVPIFYMYALS